MHAICAGAFLAVREIQRQQHQKVEHSDQLANRIWLFTDCSVTIMYLWLTSGSGAEGSYGRPQRKVYTLYYIPCTNHPSTYYADVQFVHAVISIFVDGAKHILYLLLPDPPFQERVFITRKCNY
jgi:hypothetical protein